MTTAAGLSLNARMRLTLLQQRQAFLDAGFPSLRERKARLQRLRAAVLACRTQLEDAVSADFGNRSRHETALMELIGVVESIDYLRRRLRRFMRRERRHVGLSYRPGTAYVEYQPKGIIGIMAPWNYPISLTLIPLATALSAGNRAMIKPSELTPRTSELIQQMLAQAFSPEEVSVVLGGPDAGAAFSALDFDHLLFTGSTEVGRMVMQAASANLVPVTLELGGKSPAIVARGQVNARTMRSLVFGKLSNAGQTCVAPDYVLVHEDDLDSFVSAYHDTVSAFYPRGPADADYTSIISERHEQRLQGLLADARSKGATVMEAGKWPESARGRARTLAPALVLGVSEDMAIMREEIFGPPASGAHLRYDGRSDRLRERAPKAAGPVLLRSAGRRLRAPAGDYYVRQCGDQ